MYFSLLVQPRFRRSADLEYNKNSSSRCDDEFFYFSVFQLRISVSCLKGIGMTTVIFLDRTRTGFNEHFIEGRLIQH
jgi:hypothetical protein